MQASHNTGIFLPENPADFQELWQAHKLRFPNCYNCIREFSSHNTFTAAGWRETQISGFCETCFDSLSTKEILYYGTAQKD